MYAVIMLNRKKDKVFLRAIDFPMVHFLVIIMLNIPKTLNIMDFDIGHI